MVCLKGTRNNPDLLSLSTRFLFFSENLAAADNLPWGGVPLGENVLFYRISPSNLSLIASNFLYGPNIVIMEAFKKEELDYQVSVK